MKKLIIVIAVVALLIAMPVDPRLSAIIVLFVFGATLGRMAIFVIIALIFIGAIVLLNS